MTQITTRADALTSYVVTAEQVSKCTPVQDGTTGEWFYIVESSKGDTEYRVRYNREYKKLTCTCKSGQEGNGCWHRRASLASIAIDRVEAKARAAFRAECKETEASRPAAESEEQATIARLVGQGVPTDEAIRVVYAKPKKGSGRGKRLNYDPTFSLLKK